MLFIYQRLPAKSAVSSSLFTSFHQYDRFPYASFSQSLTTVQPFTKKHTSTCLLSAKPKQFIYEIHLQKQVQSQLFLYVERKTVITAYTVQNGFVFTLLLISFLFTIVYSLVKFQWHNTNANQFSIIQKKRFRGSPFHFGTKLTKNRN